MFLVRARWRTGATVQIAVENTGELLESVAHFEDAGFSVEVLDAAGLPIARRELAALAAGLRGEQ